jgi:hypothetical protein
MSVRRLRTQPQEGFENSRTLSIVDGKDVVLAALLQA